MPVLVATQTGTEGLDGRDVTALALDGDARWAVVDGREVWHGHAGDAEWSLVATWSGPALTCLLPHPEGLLVGTAEAHLLRLDGRTLATVESFDELPERSSWYTPWGGPADTRSLASVDTETLLVNVHVGGVACRDPGDAWRALVDIDVDVHQIAVAPDDASLVVATGAAGFGRSTDGGETWRWDHDGLHGSYCRAVAVAGDTVLLTASTGPFRTRGAVYRRPLGATSPWERVSDLFDANIDTFWLAAREDDAAFVTGDGQVWVSADAGASWAPADKVDGRPRALAVS